MPETSYEYTPLKDLEVATKPYNVYGVVKFYKEPRRTRGPDWTMNVVITDESLGWDEKITFNLFCKDPASLPALTRVGDIVRFHRIKVNNHGGGLQGVSSPGFAALVFSRGDTEPKSSKPNFTFTDRDRFKVRELEEWSAPFVGEELKNRYKKISDIRPNEYFDLKCQVIGFVKMSENHVVMKVWDGTKPQRDLEILKTVESDDPRVEVDHVFYNHVRDYLVDVSVFDDHVTETDAIVLSDYVTFTNLKSFVPTSHRNVNPPSAIEFCLHQGKSYGRSVKRMSDVESDKFRKELNKIWDGGRIDQSKSSGESGAHSSSGAPSSSGAASSSKAPSGARKTSSEAGQRILSSESGPSTSAQPVTSSTSPVTSSRKRAADEVVTETLQALEKTMTMEVYSNIAVWAKRIGEEAVPSLLRLSELSETSLSACRVRARTRLDGCGLSGSVDGADASRTIVLFCQHCHFLSSLPPLDEEGAWFLEDAARKRPRLGRRCLSDYSRDRTDTRQNRKETRQNDNQVCAVPMTEACNAVYTIKHLTIRSADWLSAIEPCLRMPSGGNYYLCPQCQGKSTSENDPCILKYKFCMDVTLEDKSTKVPALIWDDVLIFDDVTTTARDVIGSREAFYQYKAKLGQFSSRKAEIVCSIRIHEKKNLRRNGRLYHVMKMDPKTK